LHTWREADTDDGLALRSIIGFAFACGVRDDEHVLGTADAV
jgi:hypothetical protein